MEGTYEITGVDYINYEDPCASAYITEDHFLEDATNELSIVYLDVAKATIAGTFQFSVKSPTCPDTFRITDGRFDFRY